MFTGSVRQGAVRAGGGGVRVIVLPDRVRGTVVTCAAEPGAVTEEAAGRPLAALTVIPPGPVVVAMPAGGGAESHIRGAWAVIAGGATGVAAAARFPAASADRIRPLVATASPTDASAGFAAAAALWITSTSEKPPWSSAVTTRSTPGSTPA